MDRVEIKKSDLKSEDKELIEIVTVNELVEGNSLFESKGFSELKVTRGKEVKRLIIPIKSSGVSELMDEFKKKRPSPPIINVVVKPEDPAYKDLRLVKKQHVKTFNLTDESYLNAMDKYETELGLKILLKGLDLVLKDKEGNIIENDDRRIEILKSQGMTGEHFTQIIRDIRKLTAWEEENEDDFLE